MLRLPEILPADPRAPEHFGHRRRLLRYRLPARFFLADAKPRRT